MNKPLCIDLFCGLGGWTEGFLAEGYECVGFDIERHDYGTGGYPGQLVIQDVRTLHGSQFKSASVIVASPPCQEFSYMAMPFSRGKQIRAALRGWDEFPAGYTGSRTITELTELFDSCFRIAREAKLPLIVENVRGAQEWVGAAAWNYGSFYLWGDLPALMVAGTHRKGDGTNLTDAGFNVRNAQIYRETIKCGGSWFGVGNNCSLMRRHSSKSDSRKAASAHIAKIPYPLANHIAKCFKPQEVLV